MNLVRQSAFAEILDVSRQAISLAVKNGTIPTVQSGKKKQIDLDDEKVKQYMNANNHQRHNIEKIARKQRKSTSKGNKDRKKNPDKIEKRKDRVMLPELSGQSQSESESEKETLGIKYFRARAEKEAELAIKAKLLNAKIRGELLVRDVVYNSIFLYLDKLHSNLERMADFFLSDVGGKIITDGSVTPEVRSIWRNEVLKQIDNTKNACMKKLKEIEKEQAR